MRYIQRVVRRVGRAAGMEWLSPHHLRHTCATRLVAVTSTVIAARVLGHADVRTVEVYAHPDRETVAAAVERASRRCGEVKGADG